MADTPADPRDPGSTPSSGDADAVRDDSAAGPQPTPGTGATPGGPAESALASTPTSALAGAAQTPPDAARAAMDRGKFLTGATLTVGGVMSAVIAVPALGFVLAPVFETEPYFEIDIGATSNYPVDKAKPWTVVTFERTPDDASGIERRVAFVRNNGDGTFTALSNVCMHLGCPVRNFGTSFGCPCHGGQYNDEGVRTAGPPVRPLNRYVVTVSNDRVILGKPYAVDEDLQPHQLKGPGQPVTGLLSYLYPPAPQ